MVLGLYYLTKGRKGQKGENKTFYSPDEVIIAYNEGKLSKHALIKVRVMLKDRKDNTISKKLIETVAGRVYLIKWCRKKLALSMSLLTKKKLQTIIADVFKYAGQAKTAKFLDDIKDLGFQMAYKGGLSMGLGDVKFRMRKEVGGRSSERGGCRVEQLHDGSDYGQRTVQPGD